MWQGSAAEYRHERDNEVVCAECGAKRKDCCTGPGGVRDAHESRYRLGQLEQEHERLQDEAHAVGLKLAEHRQMIKAARMKAGAT